MVTIVCHSFMVEAQKSRCRFNIGTVIDMAEFSGTIVVCGQRVPINIPPLPPNAQSIDNRWFTADGNTYVRSVEYGAGLSKVVCVNPVVSKGIRGGTFVTWDDSGALVGTHTIGFNKNGGHMLTGLYAMIEADGTEKYAVYDENGQRHGVVLEFPGSDPHRNKAWINKTAYNHGVPHGSWITYDDQHRSVEGDYVDGKRVGEWVHKHHLSDRISVIKTETYEAGKVVETVEVDSSDEEEEKARPFAVFWANGNLKERGFSKKGRYEGLYEVRYKNGQPHIKCNYKNGQREGSYEEWYRNGQIAVRCTYKNGQREGLYEQWYKNGQIALRYTYENGQRVKYEEYKKNDGDGNDEDNDGDEDDDSDEEDGGDEDDDKADGDEDDDGDEEDEDDDKADGDEDDNEDDNEDDDSDKGDEEKKNETKALDAPKASILNRLSDLCAEYDGKTEGVGQDFGFVAACLGATLHFCSECKKTVTLVSWCYARNDYHTKVILTR